jgi:dUTP pyrophosphatase
MDVEAHIEGDMVIRPGERALIPTGLRFELPEGYEAQARPRSGLALRNGVTVLNSPGTIDSDYRGPISILLVNLGREDFVVRDGDRIAQVVFAPVCRVVLAETDSLSETGRGEGGYGSTGV